MKKNTCILICPLKRFSSFEVYLKYIFPYKKILINNLDTNFSKNILIDQDYINQLNNIQNINKFHITIFFWNGYYDYLRLIKQINKIKKKFDRSNFKNLKFFIVGNHCIRKKQFFFINNYKFQKKELNFINEPLNFKFKRKYKIIKRLILFLRYPIEHLKFCFKNKIHFVGLSEISNELIDWFANKNKFFNKNCNYYLKYFQKLQLSISTKNLLKEIDNMFNSNKFKNMSIHNQYFVSQIIFRHFFIGKMKKYKNFFFHDNDFKIHFYLHNFSKKNYFIDLGSKLGNDYSLRSLIHFDIYKNQNFNLIMKKNSIKNYSKNFNKYLKIMFEFIDNNKEINLKKISNLQKKIKHDL